MTKPLCQQVIDEIRSLKAADPNTLSEENREERAGILLAEEQWNNRLSKYELPSDFPEKWKTKYLDTEGKEISILEWSSAMEAGNTVCKDIINGFMISTVWLGLNHSLGSHVLQIFETMIFSEETLGTAFDVYQERYATLEEAKEGHERACEMVRQKG